LEGRGWLSSIDLLPEEADAIVTWVHRELRNRDRTQTDIHAEFNERLAELGLGPISRSAFSRKSVALADVLRRTEKSRQMAKVVAEQRTPGDIDELTLLGTQTIKTLAIELLSMAGEGGASTKETLELARTFQAAVNAEAVSTKRKKDAQKDFNDQAGKVIDSVAKVKGLSADAVATIRREVLGVITA
ncbi:MAG: DUF3486 family protein, partial [Alphaproteobacteria bacterium]